jgi:branched-subunit amino acid aminotransferase/4-amino-4-deoxychorismate lyase
MLWHVAEQQVRADFESPNVIPILTDGSGGPLTETAIACFLAVVGGQVLSVPRAAILDSISLQVTQELCGKLGIGFLEHPTHVSDLQEVSEAMLTGTGFGLAGVRELFTDKGEPHRFDWPGPVFTRLLAAWSDLVGLDIAKSFTEILGERGV